jgi:hypothetical protein
MTDPKNPGTPEADSLQSYTDEVKQREEGVKHEPNTPPKIPEYPPNIDPATKTPPPG